MKGRLLGIDYGSKRVGIAVTDPLRIIASPLDTLRPQEVVDFLKKYFQTNEVAAIIIGLPLKSDQSLNLIEKEIIKFIKKINQTFPAIPVIRHDERYTSLMAQAAILQAGAKKNQRRDKTLVDKVSAAIILQSYMQSESLRSEP